MVKNGVLFTCAKSSRTLLLVVMCAAFILSACSRKTIPTLPPPPASIEIQEIDFEYFHGKARLSFRDNTKEREVKANIRIRKDSVIWMTFSVIGVQGGKALINKDSIAFLNTTGSATTQNCLPPIEWLSSNAFWLPHFYLV